MSGAFVQSGYTVDDSGGSASTIAVTLPGVTAGNLLAAHVGWGDSGGTCAVNDGTAYSVADTHRSDVTNNESGQVFYLPNVGAGSHPATATFTGATPPFRRIRLVEISGLATSSPIDQNIGNVQTAAGTSANGVTSTATSATTNANDFVVGFTQDTTEPDPGTGTLTAGTGYTISGTNLIMGLESKNVAATGAQTATFTQSVNNGRITHCVAFIQAGGGGGPTVHPLMMMGMGN